MCMIHYSHACVQDIFSKLLWPINIILYEPLLYQLKKNWSEKKRTKLDMNVRISFIWNELLTMIMVSAMVIIIPHVHFPWYLLIWGWTHDQRSNSVIYLRTSDLHAHGMRRYVCGLDCSLDGYNLCTYYY